MTGIKTVITGADYSADNVGVLGPYTSIELEGLFDLRVSHERARHNHATLGARPCLEKRADPPTWATGHVESDTVNQITFPHGPVTNADNTFFGIFEAHRAGGALPQSPFGVSLTTPGTRGQFMLANGPNFLRLYTYTRADPDDFLTSGTQRYASYTYPTDGSLDNQMVFAAGVIRNGAGLDLYIPGVNSGAVVATTALTASDLFFMGPSDAEANLYDNRYQAVAYAGNTEKIRCFGYAQRALSLADLNTIHADLTTYYAGHGLTFV